MFVTSIDNFVNQTDFTEHKGEIYEYTENFLNDLSEKDNEYIYTNYFSSDVQNRYSSAEWEVAHNSILDGNYNPADTTYKVNKESLGQTRKIVGDVKKDRYSIDVNFNILSKDPDPNKTFFEWVKEKDEFKLIYIEYPTDTESDDGYIYRTFGID